MDLLDEKGRLFGIINVVDALVILVVIGVIGVGVWSTYDIPPSEDRSEATNYATITTTISEGNDVTSFEQGTELVPASGGDTFTVVDTMRSFAPDGSVYLAARVAYQGTPSVDGSPLYTGDSVALVSGNTSFRGAVVAIGKQDAELPVRTMSVVVESSVQSVATAVEAGDTAHISGQTVATVASVERSGHSETSRVGLRITALDSDTSPIFGGKRVLVGNRITVLTDTAAISGPIVALGTVNATAMEREDGTARAVTAFQNKDAHAGRG